MSRVNDCEDCGHAYTPYYGQWYHTTWGSKWLCHDCAQIEADKAKAREAARKAAKS